MINLLESYLIHHEQIVIVVNIFIQMSLFRNFQSFPCKFLLPPSSANTVMKDDLLNKMIFKKYNHFSGSEIEKKYTVVS